MNDKQYPRWQSEVTDSEKKPGLDAESGSNEESLINLAHSVKSGNKIEFEKTLQSSSFEESEGVSDSSGSADNLSKDGLSSSTWNADDQMKEITRKLEDELITDLQTDLDKPLEINSDDISNAKQADPNNSDGNSPSGIQNPEQTDTGYFSGDRSFVQTSDAETHETGAIRTPNEESQDIASGTSFSEQETGRRVGELPDIGRNADLPEGQTESNQTFLRDEKFDAGERTSPEFPQNEFYREAGLLNESPHTMSKLNGNGKSASGLEESIENHSTDTEPQLTLPGIDEGIDEPYQDAMETREVDNVQIHSPIGQITRDSGSNIGSDLKENESSKGFAIAFFGLTAILLFGGAFYAVRSVTTDSSSIEEPPIIFADTSPMKIFPQNDENDEVRSTNGKIIFDRVGDIYQEQNHVNRLAEPSESDVTSDISNLVPSEVPNSSLEIAPVRPVRTVVLQPDGTVIEGESEVGTSNVTTGANTEDGVNRTNQSPTGNEVGNNDPIAEEIPSEENSQSESESVISEVEKILEGNSNDSNGESGITSLNDSDGSGNSSTESGISSTSLENREGDTELETEAPVQTADAVDNAVDGSEEVAGLESAEIQKNDAGLETELPAQSVSTSDNASDDTLEEKFEESIEDTSVSALDSESQPDVESLVLPRTKPANRGEGFVVTGAVANVPLELKELKEGTPVVQISADKSIESAKESFSRIQNSHAQIFKNISPIIQVGDTETGTWYRVQIEMDGYLRAIDFCFYLKSQGIECVAKRVD